MVTRPWRFRVDGWRHFYSSRSRPTSCPHVSLRRASYRMCSRPRLSIPLQKQRERPTQDIWCMAHHHHLLNLCWASPSHCYTTKYFGCDIRGKAYIHTRTDKAHEGGISDIRPLPIFHPTLTSKILMLIDTHILNCQTNP